MTGQILILPYDRSSPLHIPRRDLVLSSGDSLALSVTVVESDDPSAQALVLTGGLGGPLLRMRIWSEHSSRLGWRSDYGCPWTDLRWLLWAGDGVVSTDRIGTFDITIPAGSFAGFPRRCGFSLQLVFDGGTQAEMLAQGILTIPWGGLRRTVAIPLLTDDGAPILTDDLFVLEA